MPARSIATALPRGARARAGGARAASTTGVIVTSGRAPCVVRNRKERAPPQVLDAPCVTCLVPNFTICVRQPTTQSGFRASGRGEVHQEYSQGRALGNAR